MPEYLFQCKTTGKEWKEWMSISECEAYLKENPTVERLVYGAPAIGYSTITKKPDQGFRDMLKEVKKRNSRGVTKSTINTW